jgi:hypothetical protein
MQGFRIPIGSTDTTGLAEFSVNDSADNTLPLG